VQLSVQWVQCCTCSGILGVQFRKLLLFFVCLFIGVMEKLPSGALKTMTSGLV
jgi:hypothetical protein